MFFFRHPRPVVDGRTHAVQVVQRKVTQEVSRTLLVVEAPVTAAQAPSTAASGSCQDGAQDASCPERCKRV